MQERAKCTFRNISLSNPSGISATQTHWHTHTHAVTHCRRLTAPSGSCAAEGRMKGNTKTTTRERQVASLATPHTHAHAYTLTHSYAWTQTPSSSNPLLCTPVKVPNPRLNLIQHYIYLSCFLPTSPLSPSMNLSPSLTAPLCKHSSC